MGKQHDKRRGKTRSANIVSINEVMVKAKMNRASMLKQAFQGLGWSVCRVTGIHKPYVGACTE